MSELYVECRQSYTDANGKKTLGTEQLLPAAEVASLGGALQTAAAHQANSTATDVAGLVADFNALLAKLQAAGLMA